MFAITAFFYFYDFLLRLAPTVMMDDILKDYGITAAQFGYLDASFYYTYTPLQLFAGPFLDEFGSRRILPSAITACFIGTVMAALGGHFYWLIASRVLIGFGSAFAFVAVLKVASEWLPESYYPFLSGLTTTLGMLGGVVAEAALPLLVTYDPSLFYFTAAFIAVCIFTASLFAIEDKNAHEDNNLHLGALFADIKTALTKLQTWHIGLIGCFLFAPIQLFVTWQKSYFMHSMHITERASAHLSSMIFWGIAVGAPSIGYVTNLLPNEAKKKVLAVCSSLACVLMAVCLYAAPFLNFWLIGLLLLLLGFFTGAQPLVFVLIRPHFPHRLTATAIASVNMLINSSSFIQPYVGGFLQHSHNAFVLVDWQKGLSVVVLMLALSAILSALLPYPPHTRTK